MDDGSHLGVHRVALLAQGGFDVGAGRLHLVVLPQHAPCRCNLLAAIQRLGEVGLLVEGKIVAGFLLLIQRSVGVSHIQVCLGTVESDIAGPLLVGHFAVGVVVELFRVLLIVGQEIEHRLCHRWDVAVAPLTVEHIHLALQGDDAGIHLGPLAVAAQLVDDTVNLGQSIVGLAYLGECRAYLGLGAQGFRFQSLPSDEVQQHRRPVDGLLVVVVQSTGVHQHLQYVLSVAQVCLRHVKRYQALTDDDG